MSDEYKKAIALWKRDRSGYIAVDLDGTLAEFHTWKGPYHIGAPIVKMQERVKKWLAEGIEVKILTARATPDMDGNADPAVVAAIRAWCKLHLGQGLDVTNAKTYDMIEIWDDRAVQVIPNTGERADGKEDSCCYNGKCLECLPNE